MAAKRMVKEISFRGKLLKVQLQHFVCPKCGIEADDLNFAAVNQRRLSDAYRKAVKRLTGKEIVARRNKLNWTQEDLAKAANVGIASIKRWETGQIQTKSMDDVLRNALSLKKRFPDAPGMEGHLRRTKKEDLELTSDSTMIAMMPWRKQVIAEIQNPPGSELSWGSL